MQKEKYDFLVVGSGVGGSTIARELAKKGRKILIVEKGPKIKQGQLGNLWNAVFYPGFYNKFAIFNQSIEGTIIYATSNDGGSSVFSCGNFTRTNIFSKYGIDLTNQFVEVEQEIRIVPASLGSVAKKIMEASNKLGYNTKPMPKGFAGKCDACGNCVAGCIRGAKWDARVFLNEALEHGAKLIHGEVLKILLTSNNEVRGIKLKTGVEIECDRVILAAGALKTPVILHESGIHAGKGLFVDYFNVTYGLTDHLSSLVGISMPTFYKGNGFMLSPFLDHWSQQIAFCPFIWNILKGGLKKNKIGIMTKINDDRVGGVFSGKINKFPTDSDKDKIEEGVKISRLILRHLGLEEIITTKVYRGAHPGGTAALEEVVDKNLQVYGAEGLYICDASVFPEAPGLPPILTIIALAKRLAKSLI